MAIGMAATAVRILGGGSRRMSTKVHRSIPREIANAIKPSSSSSEFSKLFGIPQNTRSQTALLISKFIRLHTFKNPGIKRDKIWEDNLSKMLQGKNTVGFPEIAKLLSPQFSQPGGMNTNSNAEDFKQYQVGDGKEKAKKKSSKKKSSKK